MKNSLVDFYVYQTSWRLRVSHSVHCSRRLEFPPMLRRSEWHRFPQLLSLLYPRSSLHTQKLRTCFSILQWQLHPFTYTMTSAALSAAHGDKQRAGVVRLTGANGAHGVLSLSLPFLPLIPPSLTKPPTTVHTTSTVHTLLHLHTLV